MVVAWLKPLHSTATRLFSNASTHFHMGFNCCTCLLIQLRLVSWSKLGLLSPHTSNLTPHPALPLRKYTFHDNHCARIMRSTASKCLSPPRLQQKPRLPLCHQYTPLLNFEPQRTFNVLLCQVSPICNIPFFSRSRLSTWNRKIGAFCCLTSLYFFDICVSLLLAIHVSKKNTQISKK